MALEPKYSPAEIEAKWSEHWEASGAFKCGQRPDAEPYTIVMPPPNVTGSLHIGHALDNTLQDALIRFERMRGKDVLWQPGVDHAGIATQMVVERQLDEEGLNRRDMGREAFQERVWKWKDESGGTITRQLRRLGASCDWSRERFTMDEGFSRGVLKAFVSMYRAGLMYRDKRLVNWDPKLLTAISDLEVNQEDRSGHLWYFRYPIEGEEGRFLTVATTRPETMLGDTAVAVHPDDERYTDLVGKHVILPLAERRIPIIADEWADPEQGSGAVKITPAHDFNDFEVGKRHDLEMINIFDAHAALNDNVPKAYRGLDRFEARKRVVADLEAKGLVELIEPHHHTLPVGDRSGVAIEPWLTDQWYVNAEKLAKAPIKAVEEGKTRFIPKRWEKVFFEWMRNIQPWCVSRQLWWGHQIPAWYAEDGSCFVAETEEEAYAEAREQLGDNITLTRDEDVLDTWFSSALWPFGTLGWPDEAPEVARYYPNSVLITGFDIIFFWVARMMMSGMFLMKEVPFRDVYIHALICDEAGQKMSKSKGNTVDPLEFVDKYGADALRFTLAQAEAQGRDIRLSEARVEGARNFGTKLWNAARLLERNTSARDADGFDPAAVKLPLNRWIVGACRDAAAKVTQALEAYRYNETADAAYHFAWHVYCDWFLELMKVAAGDEAPADEATETRATARWAFDQILKLLHPIMPFVTEELWHALDDARETDLILASWPELGDLPAWKEEAAEIDWLIRLITEIRAIRSELNVPAAAEITAYLKGADSAACERLEAHGQSAKWLARLSSIEIDEEISLEGAAQSVIDGATLILPLEGIIDFAEERARLEKAIAKADGEIGKLEGRLANPDYRKKAPADVVAKAEAALADENAARDKLTSALARLG